MTNRRAYLALEDGTVYEGQSFGAERDSYGELVFSTSMTGYQEALTDPSFAGQLVVLTYPLVGNYGINDADNESVKVQVAGFVVREHCLTPSNGENASTLHEFLSAQNVPGIFGVDTRAVTRRLRSRGVMMGVIALDSPDRAARLWSSTPRYDDVDHVARVTTPEVYRWEGRMGGAGVSSSQRKMGEDGFPPSRELGRVRGPRIVVTDYGVKNNVLRCLYARGCEVVTAPAAATAVEILALEPDGLLLSPGPGDPALLDYAVEAASDLLGRVPVLGICLGHQVVARALGAGTFKLPFGHRGANHPVKDLATGRVYITAQNHGYAVDAATLPKGLTASHVNLNDGTIEGLVHRDMPIMTIQYHSEASPGPRDNEYIFDRFLEMVRGLDSGFRRNDGG